MQNYVTALKNEIRRLARKEVRAETISTRRAAAAHRRDIARLKRQLALSHKRIDRLEALLSQRPSETPAAEMDDSGARFSSRSVRAQRKRLNLSAGEYGRLIGVSGQTIYQWEQGKSRPRRAQFAALVAVRTIGRREARARLTSGKPKAAESAGRKRLPRAKGSAGGSLKLARNSSPQTVQFFAFAGFPACPPHWSVGMPPDCIP